MTKRIISFIAKSVPIIMYALWSVRVWSSIITMKNISTSVYCGAFHITITILLILLVIHILRRDIRKYNRRLSVIPSELPKMKYISRKTFPEKAGYYKTKTDGAGRCYTEFLDHDNIERGRVKLALELNHVIDVVPDGYYIIFISTLQDSKWQKFCKRIKKK